MGAIAELRRIAFWADALAETEAARALAGISERRFAAGAYICHRGDRLESWTGVVTGLVKISAISRDGKAMTFAGVGAGGWFGEGTVIKNEARKYDLVALRDTQLALMNRATFMWLFDTSVGFNRFLVHQLNERMGQFIATIEHDRIHDPDRAGGPQPGLAIQPGALSRCRDAHRDHPGGAGVAGRRVATGGQPGVAAAGGSRIAAPERGGSGWWTSGRWAATAADRPGAPLPMNPAHVPQ